MLKKFIKKWKIELKIFKYYKLDCHFLKWIIKLKAIVLIFTWWNTKIQTKKEKLIVVYFNLNPYSSWAHKILTLIDNIKMEL